MPSSARRIRFPIFETFRRIRNIVPRADEGIGPYKRVFFVRQIPIYLFPREGGKPFFLFCVYGIPLTQQREIARRGNRDPLSPKQSFFRRQIPSRKKIRQIPEIVLDISERLGIIGAFPKGI